MKVRLKVHHPHLKECGLHFGEVYELRSVPFTRTIRLPRNRGEMEDYNVTGTKTLIKNHEGQEYSSRQLYLWTGKNLPKLFDKIPE